MLRLRVSVARGIGATALIASFLTSAAGAGLPTTPGTCVLTTISKIGTRLIDGSTGRPIEGSGSAVSFANKGYQVSYGEEPAVSQSRRGDRVYMCLMQIPTGCPPGDDRGRVYTTTNLRTMQSWTLPDAEHRCGGA
jgi:hypothetical protein